jgi:hypothetical protein
LNLRQLSEKKAAINILATTPSGLVRPKSTRAGLTVSTSPVISLASKGCDTKTRVKSAAKKIADFKKSKKSQ